MQRPLQVCVLILRVHVTTPRHSGGKGVMGRSEQAVPFEGRPILRDVRVKVQG